MVAERDRKEWGVQTAVAMVDVLNALGPNLENLTFGEPVVFEPAHTKIPGVRTEYAILDDRVKFHFWPDPKFPVDLGISIKAALAGFPQEDVAVEYVPEVDSWYTCVANLRLGVSPLLVERILAKISKAVG